ncbi:MAG: FHA domain-containing protein [Bacillota bacterium]
MTERVIVTVQRQGEREVRDLEVPADVPSGQLAKMIAHALSWDTRPEGQQPSYKIEAYPPGRVLLLQESLAEAGVWDGAWLVIRTDGASPPASPTPVASIPPAPFPPTSFPVYSGPPGPSGDNDQTEVIDESGTTMVFDQQVTAVLKVWRGEQHEIIRINKAEFYIGRKREAVDYCEAANKNIGRVHAKIVFTEGVYYVVDLESKNGTYLNGERLLSNRQYPLKFGDKIRLANVEYLFDQA